MIQYDFNLSKNSKECSITEFYNIIKNNLYKDSNIWWVESRYEYYYINPKGNICYSLTMYGSFYKMTVSDTKQYDKNGNYLFNNTYIEGLRKEKILKELNMILRKQKIDKINKKK